VVGIFVHGLGQVEALSFTAVAGPMGLAAGAKIEMISPGETGPVEKLAALVAMVIAGCTAVNVNVTPTIVDPVVWPVPDMAIFPK
jgi:hypothetical protein